MKNISRLLSAAAAVAVLAPVAAHADDHGYYLSGNLGLSSPIDASYESAGVDNEVTSNLGVAALAAVGYQFDNSWRLEAEIGARFNGVDELNGAGAGAPEDGNVNTYSLMINGIYNIPTGTKFTPYVGVGAGVASVNVDSVDSVFGSSVDDSDTVFAYQGIAGVEYSIRPNLRAGLDYRYFRTQNPDLETAGGADVNGQYGTHTFTVGLRYLFMPKAAPAPVAAPMAEMPAAPTVPNNYIVFFDFDRSALTPDADRILAAAAENAAQAKATRIEVTGHADRAGSDRYNQRLSQRRADVVKKALVAKGVNEADIAVTALGEGSPMVATADGVREAQNRRVQVVLK